MDETSSRSKQILDRAMQATWDQLQERYSQLMPSSPMNAYFDGTKQLSIEDGWDGDALLDEMVSPGPDSQYHVPQTTEGLLLIAFARAVQSRIAWAAGRFEEGWVYLIDASRMIGFVDGYVSIGKSPQELAAEVFKRHGKHGAELSNRGDNEDRARVVTWCDANRASYRNAEKAADAVMNAKPKLVLLERSTVLAHIRAWDRQRKKQSGD